SALRAISVIPNVTLRPTYFGPSVHGVGGSTRVRRVVETPQVMVSLLSLPAYIRRHDIRVIHCTEKPRDALYGVLLGKLTGAKSVIHMHVGINHEWLSALTQWAMRNADALI